MRFGVAAVVVAFACAASVHAAELTATSRVDAVTVYPAGAEVTRIAAVKLESGEHSVLLTDVPAQAITGSIRVEGKATGRLEIGSVDTRRTSVPHADAEQAQTERKRLENEIEALKDERAKLDAQVRTAEAQRTLVTNLTQLPVRPAQPSGGAGTPGTREDWAQILGLVGTSMADIQRAILETQIKMRALDRNIQDLERKLISVAPLREERTEVKVFVSAASALDAELLIRYQVQNASWKPYYDARLTTGAKNAPPRLQLVRRAEITQRTGEPWHNVTLALSTARPAAGSAAPELQPVTVDFEPERPQKPVAAPPAAAPRAASRGRADDLAELKDEDAKFARREVAQEPAPQAVAERSAAAETAPFQVQFAIADRVTVANTGEAKRVRVDEAQIEPALGVRTVPKRDPKAYLYAKVTLPRSAPYLAGAVSLFRDQTFVGTGHLPQLAPGDEHELGFGADDSVRVRYAVIEEKRGESGLISASATDQRNYRITVKNMHERPIALTVMDQVPVSANQEIKVELTGRTPPTKRDVNEKRGVMAWEDKLGPDEERVIEFGYRTSWPATKRVVYSYSGR